MKFSALNPRNWRAMRYTSSGSSDTQLVANLAAELLSTTPPARTDDNTVIGTTTERVTMTTSTNAVPSITSIVESVARQAGARQSTIDQAVDLLQKRDEALLASAQRYARHLGASTDVVENLTVIGFESSQPQESAEVREVRDSLARLHAQAQELTARLERLVNA